MLDKRRGSLYNRRKKGVHAMPLYDAVRTPRPRKRDPRLLACIAIALTLVLLAFFPFYGPPIYSGSTAIL